MDMTEVKTEENQDNTLSDGQFLKLLADRIDGLTLALDAQLRQLGHVDQQVHEIGQQVTEIHQFIATHKPALAKALSLLDPGKGVRAFLGGKNRG